MSFLSRAVGNSLGGMAEGPLGHGSFAKAANIAAAGATVSQYAAPKEDRNLGNYAGGAVVGGGAGFVISTMLNHRTFTRPGRSILKETRGKAFMGRSTLRSFAKGSVSVGRMLQTRSGRTAMIAGGALLGGGFFGSSGSRAKGFNGQRGNRFGG